MEYPFAGVIENPGRRVVTACAGIGAFALLTFAAALVRIPLPFTPVPLTLQTLVVMLSGAFLGVSAGSFSQLLYLCIGMAGVSVFSAPGAGLLYLCGPTGGYIAGFTLAALMCGCLVSRNRPFLANWVVFFGAGLVILACGTLWLKFVSGVTVPTAVALGALPFIPGEIAKSFAAACIFRRFRKPL